MWSERATAFGLESHLERLNRMLDDTAPAVVALDAIASLSHVGSATELTSAVTRELDMIKVRGITGVLTTLTHDVDAETSAMHISPLVDTWLLMRNVESDGERNRLLFVIKSRGTAHSNQVREFVLTARGAQLVDVSVGPAGVVTGSARISLEAERQEVAARREQDIEARRGALARRAAEVDAQITALRAQLDGEAADLERSIARETRQEDGLSTSRSAQANTRGDGAVPQPDQTMEPDQAAPPDRAVQPDQEGG
jgi:circadian clock protein KaiC